MITYILFGCRQWHRTL